MLFRVRQAKHEKRKVIDIDGSYLPRKYQQLQASGIHCAPLSIPRLPPLGWTRDTDDNRDDVGKLLSKVFPTTLYHYLAEGVGNTSGNTSGKGAFRALTRGYVHWASGHMDKL